MTSTGTEAFSAHPDLSATRLDALRETVLSRAPEAVRIVADFPLASFLAAFLEHDPFLGYRHVPPALVARGDAWTARYGDKAFSAYLTLALIELIRDARPRFRSSGLPPVFLPEFEASFRRILTDIETGATWPWSLDNDIFLKDFGICRMTLVPCVTHLIYRHSGVPRRVILRQRAPLMLRATALLGLRAGGIRPFLEGHVHLRMRDDFNERGRQRCYRLVAELLGAWPDSRGLIGSSWYYDPVLGTLSPKLAYLRAGPEHGGAIFLDNGGGQAAYGALSRSATRRRLHEEGRYDPRNYLMIWLRRDILHHWG